MDLNHNDGGRSNVTAPLQEFHQVGYYQPCSLSRAKQPSLMIKYS